MDYCNEVATSIATNCIMDVDKTRQQVDLTKYWRLLGLCSILQQVDKKIG